ncbi:MAG: putative copper-exporting P-type ATPase B [Candidatus Magasanikbacteria bacterium GW2011_GWC2_40_17]|uniref:Putative copper-exporting P-type ATPase B n=1 Tax=Candidatus Magasanikbacteria bacterium GW2011_GWA2_42_32 TaxID=1619039 RepID=A0A0G1CE91_9BACT|nr:MAG: putative copper-exporting P-type ATPase B [Candidatus Magasanikbacteria bacterium GW2011_GWC2_40_17]KKS57006.1 MAG: putative copper-exporting P-type ATPase B [Candidatus Magasanikbacteria bacterium GW2011_GWA2_42_32]
MNHDHHNMSTPEDHSKMERSKMEHSQNKGYSKHEGHSVEMFKRKFYISLILTLPVLFLSPLVQNFLGFSFRFIGDLIVLWVFSSVVFFYGGLPFLQGSIKELKNKMPGMMTLISLAIAVAYFYSSAVTFGLQGEVFFWELATLIDIMLLGHWLEMRSVMGASRALEKLSQLIPDKAHVIKDKEIVDVNTSELKTGDIILIKPGEKIPSDGVVVQGDSFVNESMLTGESKPVSKTKGSKVIGGSINEEGSLQIKIEVVGEDTYLSKVINLVKSAQASKSKTQMLADKAALWLTIIAVTIGVVTFVIWLLLGKDIAFAIERAATVLIIACPHALGLAVPLVVAISTALSAQNGLLIRNRTAFENSRRISTIVFDKTGTLTEGTFTLTKIYNFDTNYSQDKALGVAASLEKNSEHPIARAVVKEAENLKIKFFDVKNFRAIKGKGIEGIIQEKLYILASPGYLEELTLTVPSELRQTSATIIYLIDKNENKLVCGFALSDVIRPESRGAINLLKKEGIKVWMLTGDNSLVAKEVSEELGLDGYFAEVLPDQKQDKIKELQGKGEYVAMVGDGINDAPALAQADVGIAIGSGTDIAAETADIILVNSNPKDIASLILFGKATYNKMIQNLIWATGYNVVAIPLAAGVLYGSGILLSPALGAVFMSLSTIIVAINAKTLKVKK